jgi:branched-chain amino acid transport system ATP-binding protein
MPNPTTPAVAGYEYDRAVLRAKLAGLEEVPGVGKPDPILTVDNIARHFGGVQAVDVKHLQVQRGAITALIGPNGAGKTTFFNLITGFDRASTARGRFTGKDADRFASWSFNGKALESTGAARVAQLGMVRTFQLTKALSKMTVLDNMLLGAKDQGGEHFFTAFVKPLWVGREKQIHAKAEELLARFKLDQKKNDYAGSLSGGQRKLLEMARALMSDPAMIMLDEPMAGVNPALTQSLLGHIQALRDEGTTVLFVEHDMHVVSYISDWVVVMAEGSIVAEGQPANVMKNPAVIDAYLGAHHDVDLGDDSLLAEETETEDEKKLATLEATHKPTTTKTSTTKTTSKTSGQAERQLMVTYTGTGKPVLEANDLYAGYLPGINILNGCTITAYPGELIGIIGPNGAGKSTLLKAIFGLVPIRKGHVSLNGTDITGSKANRLVQLGVGFVPQNNNIFPTLTIEENLQMGLYLRPHHLTQRLTAMYDLFPVLANRRNQRAGGLSGGERQSVAMARALMMDPTVLLLDEPSAGLSPVRQDETFIRTRRINATGVSVIMVEQNARRCLQICDRGYVLDQGKDSHTGTGHQLADDPKVIELYLGTLATDLDNTK